MTKLIIAIVITQILVLANCSKTEEIVSQKINIEGNWILKNVFLGDFIDSPCGITGTTTDSKITFNVTSKNQNSYDIAGKSVVNSYNAKLNVLTQNFSTQSGTMNVSSLATTEMLGTAEAIGCENRYLNILSNAKEYKIVGGKLLIGVFNKNNIPTIENGGTYLIFEKLP